MNDWTAGYVADIGYTFGYYTELNPLRVKPAFLNAGLAFPKKWGQIYLIRFNLINIMVIMEGTYLLLLLV